MQDLVLSGCWGREHYCPFFSCVLNQVWSWGDGTEGTEDCSEASLTSLLRTYYNRYYVFEFMPAFCWLTQVNAWLSLFNIWVILVVLGNSLAWRMDSNVCIISCRHLDWILLLGWLMRWIDSWKLIIEHWMLLRVVTAYSDMQFKNIWLFSLSFLSAFV